MFITVTPSETPDAEQIDINVLHIHGVKPRGDGCTILYGARAYNVVESRATVHARIAEAQDKFLLYAHKVLTGSRTIPLHEI